MRYVIDIKNSLNPDTAARCTEPVRGFVGSWVRGFVGSWVRLLSSALPVLVFLALAVEG